MCHTKAKYTSTKSISRWWMNISTKAELCLYSYLCSMQAGMRNTARCSLKSHAWHNEFYARETWPPRTLSVVSQTHSHYPVANAATHYHHPGKTLITYFTTFYAWQCKDELIRHITDYGENKWKWRCLGGRHYLPEVSSAPSWFEFCSFLLTFAAEADMIFGFWQCWTPQKYIPFNWKSPLRKKKVSWF